MARVYVGTYHKYNEGNLSGKWVDLSDFSTYDDFLRYCREIHKDEKDPELMIQDCEGFPDGLSCLEWLTEEDFNDVKNAIASEIEEQVRMETGTPSYEIVDYSEKALAVIGDTRSYCEQFKALGGRFNPRLSCGAGWIFSKRKEDELRQIIAQASVVPGESRKTAGKEFTATLDEWIETLDSKWDKDYQRKHSAGAVKLPEGYIVIDKPRIENKFCFHDEGPDYEFYKTLMKDENKLRNYFLSENLEDFDENLKYLRDDSEPVYAIPAGWNGLAKYVTRRYSWDFSDCVSEQRRQMTKEERSQVIALTQYVRDAFEKRLQAYLKKYGTSKLHTWTYWADA